jgi:CMP-N-acetylneuraminic acid synthetase
MGEKMIISLLIGRKGSQAFPNKNLIKLYGKYIFEYPIIASINSKLVNKIYISTDCNQIKKISKKKYKCQIIDRPKFLSSNKALGDHVFRHGYFEILKKEKINKNNLEFIILLFANSATLTSTMIKTGINFLRKNKSFDSAVSVSRYNMWSPLRARRVSKNGSLKPFVPFETFGDPKTLNCDRDSQGDVYFADMGVSIVRPKCLENMENNLLPQKWMGNKIAPIYSQGGFDIDYEWQMPLLKSWVKNHHE